MYDEAEEDKEYKTSYTLSGYDKLDWRRRIEEQMWRTVQARSRYGQYHIEVIKLEDCTCTNFYGLDFMNPINKNIEKLDESREKFRSFFIKNLVEQKIYYEPKSFNDLTFRDKSACKHYIYEQYWHGRFQFVRDILAANRGLLWGTQKLPGGSQMED